jgi:hypothetical protein
VPTAKLCRAVILNGTVQKNNLGAFKIPDAQATQQELLNQVRTWHEYFKNTSAKYKCPHLLYEFCKKRAHLT